MNSLSQNLTAVHPFRLLPLVAATFPKGTASEVAAKFPAQRKGVPLGELANVVSLRGYNRISNRPGCNSAAKVLQ